MWPDQARQQGSVCLTLLGTPSPHTRKSSRETTIRIDEDRLLRGVGFPPPVRKRMPVKHFVVRRSQFGRHAAFKFNESQRNGLGPSWFGHPHCSSIPRRIKMGDMENKEAAIVIPKQMEKRSADYPIAQEIPKGRRIARSWRRLTLVQTTQLRDPRHETPLLRRPCVWAPTPFQRGRDEAAGLPNLAQYRQ